MRMKLCLSTFNLIRNFPICIMHYVLYHINYLSISYLSKNINYKNNGMQWEFTFRLLKAVKKIEKVII